MYLKITAAITVLIAFVLGLAVLMNYAKFERAFSSLTESRLAFLVQDLRETLEFGLDLGLDPAAMANTASILAREAAKDPQILSILVFDDQGQVLHRHQREALIQPLRDLPPGWFETALRTHSTATPWRASDPDTLIVGATLTNNFGRAVGGIALRYDRSFHDRELAQALAGLTQAAGLILLAAALIALVSVWLLFRSARRDLKRVGVALTRFLDDADHPAFQPGRGSKLEAGYAAAEQSSREFRRRLRQAERILRLEQRLSNQGKADD